MAGRQREASRPRERQRDPRAEPDEPLERLEALAVDRVGKDQLTDTSNSKSPTDAEKNSETDGPADIDAPEPGLAPRVPIPSVSPLPLPQKDVLELERLVARGDWWAVRQLLDQTPAQEHQELQALLYVVAQKETQSEAEKSTSNERAITLMAQLFGLQPTSPIALVLAKRLVRRNPSAWREKAAPRTPISVVIALVGVALGAFLGYQLTFGKLSRFAQDRSRRTFEVRADP